MRWLVRDSDSDRERSSGATEMDDKMRQCWHLQTRFKFCKVGEEIARAKASWKESMIWVRNPLMYVFSRSRLAL